MNDCLQIEVHVRLQTGRVFWSKGTAGPGQLGGGRIQRRAFWLRNKLDAVAMPME
jgi:hypothetical protein